MAKSTKEELDIYAEIINVPDFWLSLAVVGFTLFTLSAIIAVSNAVLLFTIYKDPRRSFRTPPSFLIANLSASEFLQGIAAVFPVALRDVYRYHGLSFPYVKVFKAVTYTVACTTLFVSSATIIVMSLTCYISINNPIVYKSRITIRKIKITIALVWIIALLMSLLPVTNLPEKTYMLIYLHTHASVPIILLTVTHFNVFRAFGRRTREARQSFQGSPAEKLKHTVKRQRNMVITIITILILFYITYIPQYITLHLLYFCKACQDSVTFYKIDVALSRFLFISSAVDPFIYAWRFQKYRRAMRDCFKIIENKVSARFKPWRIEGLPLSRGNTNNEASDSSGL